MQLCASVLIAHLVYVTLNIIKVRQPRMIIIRIDSEIKQMIKSLVKRDAKEWYMINFIKHDILISF